MCLMIKTPLFFNVFRLLRSTLYILFAFSILMSGVRLYLYFTHTTSYNTHLIELFKALWLGLRLDMSILAYIMAIPTLYLLVLWSFKLSWLVKKSEIILRIYLFVMLSLISLILLSDIAYYSFFSEHITLMIFGIMDDDTQALFEIAKKNYNLFLIGMIGVIYLSGLYLFIRKSLMQPKVLIARSAPFVMQIAFFFITIAMIALVGRGSIGIFPLAKDIADVSEDPLINKLPKNGVYAMVDAFDQYSQSKDGSYDLIKSSGYKGKIAQAFALHVRKKVNPKNLLASLIHTTPKNNFLAQHPPHVVVVMVESFGLPVLSYQSKDFDILRRLKKHFDEDTVFTRFISAGNGTIVSLEPLLLNITARPESTAFAQSTYLNTAFRQASARVYQNAGYESSFVYGGDLSWRNVGNFMSRQGFDHQYGKAAIVSSLGIDEAASSHDWGVFDQYTYNFVIKKLKEARKPQFIFVLTTNNHPPYTIPKTYDSKPLHYSPELDAHITGDKALAKERFKDYQYALDMAGRFMDTIKKDQLSDNTVVAITGDNNTVEGIMHYDDYYNETKKIPFYLYLPKAYRVNDINTSVAGSHKDIFPTLYNLTLSGQSYIGIGTDLRDRTALHCGFNDAGILMANDGGFKADKPQSTLQKECARYYKASLAVTEYLIQLQEKVPKISN